MSVIILSFNAIHSVIKTMFHKVPVAANGGLSEMAYLICGYFSIFGTSVDGHEQIMT
jgi:hypothetical protein